MRRVRGTVPPATEADRRRVRDLVAMSEGDPLAPFALRPEKSNVFAPDGTAAVGYRVRLGTALASGDPVGDPDAWGAAVDEFMIEMRHRGLRAAVLGAGERSREYWARYGLSGLAIGRDVVLHRDTFTTTGRRFRNLRQAIQRSRNAGVGVEMFREGELASGDTVELRMLMTATGREDRRGFSMILDRLFDGTEPDAVILLARDGTGRIVGAHRYLWAGKQDLSLDLPIRAHGAPNGVDERLVAEVLDWGTEHGVERVSLAFAPFPELFGHRAELSAPGRLAYHAVHLLDPLIRVERLYTYLRKFHSFDQQRFVMLRRRQVIVVAAAALLLEFGR
jgi:lysylphosphatidylglycerol synthetase-like protein (DUF2156 family)